jgi:hypothetical protein
MEGQVIKRWCLEEIKYKNIFNANYTIYTMYMYMYVVEVLCSSDILPVPAFEPPSLLDLPTTKINMREMFMLT